MSIKLSKYLVYGLIDPRTSEMFYIGKSCTGSKSMYRHTQPHSLNEGRNPLKVDRILEIVDDGLKVEFIVLAECRSRKEVERRERVFIAEYRDDGLLNIKLGKGKCDEYYEGKS